MKSKGRAPEGDARAQRDPDAKDHAELAVRLNAEARKCRHRVCRAKRNMAELQS